MSRKYDLTPLKAPTTSGLILRLSTQLIERMFPGNLLANKLLKDVGMDRFRAAPCPEALSPIPPLFEASDRVELSIDQPLPEIPKKLWGKTDYPYERASDFIAAYTQGQTTPSQVAERLIKRIEHLEGQDPALCCVIEQRAEDLRAQARESTARYAQGNPLGPLDGVPVGVKDELDLKGYSSRVGTSFMGAEPARQDAFAVHGLRTAGALLFGKLNMHEIGIGVTGINPHYGAARNPHDLSCITGGSSSGSASAIAAGLGPISVGADGGGSIRMPAALCGVVGLKPTYGRISEHGAAPLCWSVAHVGPLGASIYDTALAYAAMAGPDSADPNTFWQPPLKLDDSTPSPASPIRLGVFEPWFEDAQDSIVEACRHLLDTLATVGVELVPIELPDLGLLRTAHMVTISTEMLSSQRKWLEKHRSDYGCDTRLNLALAERISADDYIRAQRMRGRFFRHFMTALEGVDAIVTPTTGCTATPINPKAESYGESNLTLLDQIMRFAPAANLTGLPALSIPIGFDGRGLPIGIQLMGAPWSEAKLLGIGSLIEQQAEHRISAVHQSLIES